jgi:hypothetical protein
MRIPTTGPARILDAQELRMYPTELVRLPTTTNIITVATRPSNEKTGGTTSAIITTGLNSYISSLIADQTI